MGHPPFTQNFTFNTNFYVTDWNRYSWEQFTVERQTKRREVGKRTLIVEWEGKNPKTTPTVPVIGW